MHLNVNYYLFDYLLSIMYLLDINFKWFSKTSIRNARFHSKHETDNLTNSAAILFMATVFSLRLKHTNVC